MLKLEEARRIVLDRVPPMPPEEVYLLDALQRTLAEDIVAFEPVPPFDRSPLDGYAVRAADIAGATEQTPVALREIEQVFAGSMARHAVTPGTAIRIMTGAPIPLGADTVIRLEDTVRDGDRILVTQAEEPAANICWQGEDVTPGEVVVTRGTVITPPVIGMLAALGYPAAKVAKKPQVVVMATGNELVAVDKPLAAGQIRDSNTHMIASQILACGGDPIVIGTTGDSVPDIVHKLMLWSDADLILTTGGVSVGDHDVVRAAHQALGAEELFWRVAIKPGTPVLCSAWNDKLLIGLSGNPAAASISFEQLVRPALNKMLGRRKLFLPEVEAVLGADFPKASGQQRYIRARVQKCGDLLYAYPVGLQNPGILKSLLAANGLICVPAGSGPLRRGEKVTVQILTEIEVDHDSHCLCCG